jgi:hypothetical protein
MNKSPLKTDLLFRCIRFIKLKAVTTIVNNIPITDGPIASKSKHMVNIQTHRNETEELIG